MAKQCVKCLEYRDESRFGKTAYGFRLTCKDCRNKNNRMYYAKNKGKIRSYQKRWDSNHKEIKLIRHLFYKYKITLDEFNELKLRQNNKCLICLVEFSDTIKPQIDHNHKCCDGRITCGKCTRGLLCGPCNRKLEALENVEWYNSAKSYLANN